MINGSKRGKMAFHRFSFVVFFFIMGQPGAIAEQSQRWEVIANKDGILVSEFINQKTGQKRFRGIGRVGGNMYEVMTLLHDVERYTEWMYKTIEAKLLKKMSSHRLIIYNRLDAPWPFQDRDVVVDVEAKVVDPGKRAI